MLIGELAEQVGVSPRSLRHYEKAGLLSPERDGSGYRRYDERAAVRAANIRDLLDVGLTLDGIRGYAADGCLDAPLDEGPRCAAELDTAHHRLAAVEERLARLQRVRDRLARHTAEVARSVAP
ncbi:MerR family transcriptional regulator [Nocardiopsis coralliicola]